MLNALGAALYSGDTLIFARQLTDNCIFYSQFNEKTERGKAAVLNEIRNFAAKNSIHYNIVDVQSVFSEDKYIKSLNRHFTIVYKDCLLIYKNNLNNISAVVVCTVNLFYKINGIYILSNKSLSSCNKANSHDNESTSSPPSNAIDGFYSIPQSTYETVYSDNKYQIKKIWKWNAESIHEDHESGLLIATLRSSSNNNLTQSLFASINGKFISSITFNSAEAFNEGLCLVDYKDYGLGFIDKNMDFIIPPKFSSVGSFKYKSTLAYIGDTIMFITSSGNEFIIQDSAKQSKYNNIYRCSNGMYGVSIKKLASEVGLDIKNDYYVDLWGTINKNGECVNKSL